MKTVLLTVTLLAAVAGWSQTNTNTDRLRAATPPAPLVVTVDTNNPPDPGTVRSNLLGTVARASGGAAIVGFALDLLPYWDRNATNSYGSGELIFGTGPAFKSATVSGSTPYLSIYSDWMPTRYFGLGVDMVTFGNGTGTSDLDSAHGYLIGRKDVGNVAGLVEVGGGRNVTWSKYDFEAGGGLEFMYSTGVALRLTTRYVYYPDKIGSFSNAGSNKASHEFLTELSLNIRF